MTWLRLPRSAAVIAGLLALGLLPVGPIYAAGAQPDAGQAAPKADQHPPDNGDPSDSDDPDGDDDSSGAAAQVLAPVKVNFRKNPIFSCVVGGDNTGMVVADTATISSARSTITATVTVHATPGTTVFANLTQGGCARMKFFTIQVRNGTGTATVTDQKVGFSNRAFVWFVETNGTLEMTPAVVV
jgi:hypothetical protein